MDTQWQRYEVFEKERPDLPYRNAGSVHAPDGEMALENARDVFVRRPSCMSLWVVPERAVFSKTIQELEEEGWLVGNVRHNVPDKPEPYLVFQKQSQTARETYVVHVGQVVASSPEQAMGHALDTFSHTNVFVWWVVPARVVVQSQDDDAPSMFEPAQTKRYRQHLAYPVEPIMRKLKSAQEFEGLDGS